MYSCLPNKRSGTLNIFQNFAGRNVPYLGRNVYLIFIFPSKVVFALNFLTIFKIVRDLEHQDACEMFPFEEGIEDYDILEKIIDKKQRKSRNLDLKWLQYFFI